MHQYLSPCLGAGSAQSWSTARATTWTSTWSSTSSCQRKRAAPSSCRLLTPSSTSMRSDRPLSTTTLNLVGLRTTMALTSESLHDVISNFLAQFYLKLNYQLNYHLINHLTCCCSYNGADWELFLWFTWYQTLVIYKKRCKWANYIYDLVVTADWTKLNWVY